MRAQASLSAIIALMEGAMLKKLVASVVMISALALGPGTFESTASAAVLSSYASPAPIKDYDPGCMLNAGCWFYEPGDNGQGTWICPDQSTYMNCIGPG